MNTPVNFETAKLLKKKGFNKPCIYLYFDGELKEITVQKVSYDDTLSSRYYIAPTIAEVVMWLYDKYGVWISVLQYNSKNVNGIYFKSFINAITFSRYDLPTEAYEAAIDYTLKNLNKRN